MRIVSESVRWKLQYLFRDTIESVCSYDPFFVDIFSFHPDISETIMQIFWSCMFLWIRVANDLTKCVIQTQRFNCIMKKILQFLSHTFGYYPHFLSAIFGAYSLSLFGFSVIYFLLRILGYKLGFVQGPTYHKYFPRRRGSGKSSIRSIKYKKYRHRKKRRIKNKRATRSPFVKLFSSALTTVLNVD